MLNVIPKSWLSWDCEFLEGKRQVAELKASWLREKALVQVGQTAFEVGRDGLVSGSFFLKRDGHLVATANKPSALQRSYVMDFGGTRYTLRAAAVLRRKFELVSGEQVVGSVYPERWIGRRSVADLPEDLPLEVRVFLTWLVLTQWKRQQNTTP